MEIKIILEDILTGVEVRVVEFTGDGNRRQLEQEAVGRLVAERFGADVTIDHRDDGSPVLKGDDHEISVSHCKGKAVLAVDTLGRRIGVDIEQMRPTLYKVRSKYLSSIEMENWTSESDLLLAWTVKEAVYKAAGVSGIDFSDDISLPPVAEGEMMVEVKNKARYAVHSRLVEVDESEPMCRLTVAVPVTP